MLKKTSLLLDDKTHDRLKGLAAENGLTIGGQIRRLVDHFEGVPNYMTNEYKTWISAVIRVGNLGGDDAAQEYIKKYPCPK